MTAAAITRFGWDPKDVVLNPADENLVASASIITDFEDTYLAELTGAVEQSLRSIRQMVIERLRARATILTPIAASAGEFTGNPWHDEVGRFAPKGTGKKWDSIEALVDQAKSDDGTTAMRFKDEGAARVIGMMTAEERQAIADELNGHMIIDEQVSAAATYAAFSGLEIQARYLGIKDTARLPVGVAMQAAAVGMRLDYAPADGATNEKLAAAVNAYEDGGSAEDLSLAMTEATGIDPAHGAVVWRNGQWKEGAVTPGMVAFHLDAAQRYGLDTAQRALYGYYPSGAYDAAQRIRDLMPTTISTILSADRFLVEDTIANEVEGNPSTVTLYRGVKHTGHSGADLSTATIVQTNPLSSWTTNQQVARSFAGDFSTEGGYLIQADVPIDQIIGMASLNGWGSLAEREVIVMGRPIDAATITPINRDRLAAAVIVGDVLYPDDPELGGPDWIKITPIAASAGEFANPWHDEIGRFAPKGTGTKSDGSGEGRFNPDYWDRSGPEPVWVQPHGELVRDALYEWKGSNSSLAMYLNKELSGDTSTPPSGNGKIWQAQARALLRELEDHGLPVPRLYRGEKSEPTGLRGWSQNRRTARNFARKSGGKVWELAAGSAKGLRIADYAPGSGLDQYEQEWIVLLPSGVASTSDAGRQSGTEFANPWHDEVGRFAPKGTGRKFGKHVSWHVGSNGYEVMHNGEWTRAPEAIKHYGAIEVAQHMTPLEARQLREELDGQKLGDLDNDTDVTYKATSSLAVLTHDPTLHGKEGFEHLQAQVKYGKEINLGLAMQLYAAEQFTSWDKSGADPRDNAPGGIGPLKDLVQAHMRGEVDDATVSKFVTDEYGITVESAAVGWFNRAWQISAVSHESTAMQIQIAELRGLSAADAAMRQYVGESTLSKANDLTWAMGATINAVTSAHIRNTQEKLAQAPELALPRIHRGLKGDQFTGIEAGDIVQSNPLSSWSFDPNQAKHFATNFTDTNGIVITAEFDPANVLTISDISGMGSLDEREVIMIGQPITVTRAEVHRAREYAVDTATVYLIDTPDNVDWITRDQDGLVAAGPFDLSDFNVMTPEEWAAAFDVEAADIIGDVVVDAATGQPLRAGLNVSDKVITDLIDRHIGRLQDLGPVVQASLRDALTLAVRNQLGLDDVIREIQASGPLGETAARAIARTELTAATNGGMLTGWRRDGFPFKQWKSLHDERVRHAHLEADGQIVPTEQEFEVGGWRAQYPGDPRLPVHLRINCRCFMDRIGADGETLTTRLVDATRTQLYRLAQELQIPGRSKMRKDDLFQAIDRYRNGFGNQSLEEMTKAQLLIRARTANIVGRSRMNKPELMVRLRDLSRGRNRDRWLVDAGHGTREQLDAVRAQLAADLAALAQGPIVGAGPPPTVERIDTIRRRLFRRYGGAETGTALCVGCGARLHWSNTTRWEQMTMIRLNPKLAWSSRNAMPVCLADLTRLAGLDAEQRSKAFTIEFANPWHDEVGQFAPKGTGTNFANIARRADQAEAAGSQITELDLEQAAILSTRLNEFTKEMGPEFEADDGVKLTQHALNQRHGHGSMHGFAATDPNGVVLGAIAYTTTPSETVGGEEFPADYHIEFVGSTGLIKGVGTQLVIPVMRQAAADGAKVTLKIAGTKSAGPFWEGMGFEHDWERSTGAHMYPDEVQAWVDNLDREREGVLVAAGPPSDDWDLDDDRWAAHAIELGLMQPAIVASAAQFANPWHDEIGRFAPKGTGTKSGAERLLDGEDVTVAPEDADDVLLDIANADHAVDLTRLHLEGSDHLFAAMRGNGIPRSEMPQIPKKHLRAFQKFLRKQGVKFGPDRADPRELKATQSELDGRKAGQVLRRHRSGEPVLEKPIWVSQDGHVLDGHHHWAAAAVEAADKGTLKVPIIRVRLPMKKLLKLANKFVDKMGIPRQSIDHPGRVPYQPVAAAMDDETFYEMATDEELGITIEDLADLPHGDGSAFADDSKFTTAFANPWHDEIGRFAPKGTGSSAGPSERAKTALAPGVETIKLADIGINDATPEQAKVAQSTRDDDALWATAEPRMVSVHDRFVGTEGEVKAKHVRKVVIDGEPLREGYPPRLYELDDGSYLIVDGHHRVVMHNMLESPEFEALVLPYPKQTFAIEFANPWHDEKGKFAPKGTGTKYDSAAVKGKVKASMEAGVNVDRLGDPQPTLTKLDAWADKMGPDFVADEGVGMMREALKDAEFGSKALIANHKTGIAGILSYDYDTSTGMYTIHHLGSTGIAPGTGTRLAAQVMIQAAGNGAGITFEAANNDTAPEFWSSLGFDVSDPANVVMSPSDVGAWMRDFTS